MTTLHITSGDIAGELLLKSDVPGEILVWRDILYTGPRNPGWPDEDCLKDRAIFLEKGTGGGVKSQTILSTLKAQYKKLQTVGTYDAVVLWFDACLFDQAMLCHILSCMQTLGYKKAELLCIDAFPGIEPYHGLGQLTVEQLAACYDRRQPLSNEQFLFAEIVDSAFALQDRAVFNKLSLLEDAALPWIPAAIRRWLEEQPDSKTGLGRLEQLILDALQAGCSTPEAIYTFVAQKETPPQFWGDITLWEKINALSDRRPPLLKIKGPMPHLPQWEGIAALAQFKITL